MTDFSQGHQSGLGLDRLVEDGMLEVAQEDDADEVLEITAQSSAVAMVSFSQSRARPATS